MAGAVALLGTAGFTSCKEKNGPVDPGTGNYNGETVKTEFLINIADNAAGPADRWNMPGTTVQVDETRASFRGMDSIRLVPYAADYSGRIGKTIVLSPIVAGTTGLPNKSNSKLYSNVAIPLGTERFLFYGKAVDMTAGTPITTVAQMHQFGTLAMAGLWPTGNVEKESISFTPVPIYTYTGTPNEKAKAIVDYLTVIANDTTHWSALNEGLQQLRTDMLSMASGSSYAVQEMIEDMYNSLERYNDMQVSPNADVTAIMNDIATKAEGCSTTGSVGDRSLTLTSDLAGYPANINLPEGAARILWDNSDPDRKKHKFIVVDNSNIGTNLETNLSSYVYPANLQYFAQSEIATSNKSQATAYADGSKWWKDILGLYTDDDKVTTSTKSVAIKDTIQYGVGQLKTTVKLKETLLKDSKYNETTPSEGTPKVNVDGTANHQIKWQGVLIGDQRPVDYKFDQDGTGTAYTIYDNYLDNNGSGSLNGQILLSTVESYPNYTLVLPTKDNTGMTHDVYVALELINNAGDFFGVDGKLIPDGGTFYLVGKLNAGQATGASINPHAWNIFYKDYVTKANFTISSLANAYYTIPDLRSSNLELGFSVDLKWQAGLVFDIEIP